MERCQVTTICGLNVVNFKKHKTYLRTGTEYLLQQQNDDDYLDLESRALALKIRIRQAKQRLTSPDAKPRIETKIDVPEDNDLDSIKSKLLGRK